MEDQLEELLEDPEGEGDAEALGQALLNLAENPVNLNRADLWTLLQVPGMNLRLAQAVMDHRAASKPFETVDEITAVKGIGPVTLEKFRPYLTVGGERELRGLLYRHPRYWTHGASLEVISRFRGVAQRKEGYRRAPEEGGYTGSPLQYYQRVKYAGDHLSANLLLEKDAGEPLPAAGKFDHRSWHLAVKDIGRVKTVVAGDYTVSAGQGLVMRGGGLFGKGSEVISGPVRSGGGVRPHTSASEGSALRGVAATAGEGVRVTGFWSDRRLGATDLPGDSTGSPRSGGLHRTLTERSARKTLRERLYGGRLQVRMGGGVAGVTGYQAAYDAYVYPGDAPWQEGRFRGRRHGVAGIDFAFPAGPALLFGEAARSANGAWGAVAGLEGAPDENTRLTAVYRNYGRRFQSPLGSGFGEGSGAPGNEEGFYLGASHRPLKDVELRGYLDHFYFPGPRFGVRRPTDGFEWLGMLRWKPNSDTEAYLQVRSERKGEEYMGTDEAGRRVRLPGRAFRQTWRLHLQHRVHARLRLRSRLEIARGHPAGRGDDRATGYLLYQDLRLRPANGVTVDTRMTFFDTPTFETRIYQFENNLLHVLSNRMLQGRGERFYLLVRIRAAWFLDFWARFGTTRYRDRATVGSGLERIEGNRRTDLGFQMRLKF